MLIAELQDPVLIANKVKETTEESLSRKRVTVQDGESTCSDRRKEIGKGKEGVGAVLRQYTRDMLSVLRYSPLNSCPHFPKKI